MLCNSVLIHLAFSALLIINYMLKATWSPISIPSLPTNFRRLVPEIQDIISFLIKLQI